MNKDYRHIEIKIYESSTQLRIVPNERPNVVKISLQRAAQNKKGEWYYKTLKSFRLTTSQARQLNDAVNVLASDNWSSNSQEPTKKELP
jgi:hypothetical protein